MNEMKINCLINRNQTKVCSPIPPTNLPYPPSKPKKQCWKLNINLLLYVTASIKRNSYEVLNIYRKLESCREKSDGQMGKELTNLGDSDNSYLK